MRQAFWRRSLRRRAEDLLRESETRFAEARRIAHIGSWELDLLKNKLNWSDEIFRIFEIDPALFPPSYARFLAAVRPEDRERVIQAYTDSVAKHPLYDIVHRLLIPDGRVKFVRDVCETTYGENGEPARSLGTVQDITELKRILA